MFWTSSNPICLSNFIGKTIISSFERAAQEQLSQYYLESLIPFFFPFLFELFFDQIGEGLENFFFGCVARELEAGSGIALTPALSLRARGKGGRLRCAVHE
jgi:hypothetical protein